MATTAEDEILERAGLTRELIVDLPLASRLVDGAQRVWEVNQSAPGSSAQKVHSIFAADEDGAPGDVRIYALSTVEGEMSARYTVNRHDGGSMREHMSDEAFMDEIAAEMTSLAVSKGILEECPDEGCGGVNQADAAECAECGRKLETEDGSETPVDGQPPTSATPTEPAGSATEM